MLQSWLLSPFRIHRYCVVPELEINELRRVLNQASTLFDVAITLAAPDEDLEKRLRGIAQELKDEQSYLDGLARLRFPQAGRAY
jgi:hypothetical protein